MMMKMKVILTEPFYQTTGDGDGGVLPQPCHQSPVDEGDDDLTQPYNMCHVPGDEVIVLSSNLLP